MTAWPVDDVRGELPSTLEVRQTLAPHGTFSLGLRLVKSQMPPCEVEVGGYLLMCQKWSLRCSNSCWYYWEC